MDNVDVTEKSEIPKYRWVILAVSCLGTFSGFLAMNSFASIAPFLIEGGVWSVADLGLWSGITTVFCTLFLMPSGILADKYGRKIITGFGLIIWVIASIIFPISPVLKLLSRALMGIGYAMLWVAPSALLVSWFSRKPSEIPAAIGTLVGFWMLGGAVTMVLPVYLFFLGGGLAGGEFYTFMIMGVIVLVIAIVFWVFGKEKPTSSIGG